MLHLIQSELTGSSIYMESLICIYQTYHASICRDICSLWDYVFTIWQFKSFVLSKKHTCRKSGSYWYEILSIRSCTRTYRTSCRNEVVADEYLSEFVPKLYEFQFVAAVVPGPIWVRFYSVNCFCEKRKKHIRKLCRVFQNHIFRNCAPRACQSVVSRNFFRILNCYF